MACVVISILLEEKDGEEPSVKSQKQHLDMRNVHYQAEPALKQLRRENRGKGQRQTLEQKERM